MTPAHQKGLMLAGITAIISGIANFANAQLVVGMDPLIQNVVKNGLVGVALIALLVASSKWHVVKRLSKKQWLQLAAIAVIGGSIPFVLFFTGVKAIGAVPGSMIHKTLVFWVVLMALPLLKEKLSWKLLAGATLLYVSNFAWGFKSLGVLGMGHLMVFAATILWAIENVIAKKALATVDTDVVVSARMGGGAVILAALMQISGKTPLLMRLSSQQWLMLLVVAVLLLGYVMTWYRALKVAPVTQVAAVLVAATVVTNVLNAVLIKHAFTFVQLSQAVLMVAGLGFVVMAGQDVWKQTRKTSPAPTQL